MRTFPPGNLRRFVAMLSCVAMTFFSSPAQNLAPVDLTANSSGVLTNIVDGGFEPFPPEGFVFDPPPGFYRTAQDVRITHHGEGVPSAFRFTTDGREPTQNDLEYWPPWPIQLRTNATIRVKGWFGVIIVDANGQWHAERTESASASYTFDFGVIDFDPPAGEYQAPQLVRLKTPNATNLVIRYTTNGADPTETDPIFSERPIQIDGTPILKARAWHPEFGAGAAQSANYLFSIAPIQFDPPATNVLRESKVLTSTATPSVQFYYVAEPATLPVIPNNFILIPIGLPVPENAIPFNGEIVVSSNVFLKIFAEKTGYRPAYAQAQYLIQRLERPEFSPWRGPITNATAIAIKAETNAVIRYTTDGTEPGLESPIYQNTVTVVPGMKLKARAFHPLSADSFVRTTTYRTPKTNLQISPALNGAHMPRLKFEFVAPMQQPVWITHADDESGRVYMVSAVGAVSVSGGGTLLTAFAYPPPNINGPRAPIPLLPNFQRLISIAFPPEYESRAYFYLSYGGYSAVFVVRVPIENSTASADVSKATHITTLWPEPDGGQLVFGPDGTLFMNRAGPISSAMPRAFFEDADAVAEKLQIILKEPGEPELTETKPWEFRNWTNSIGGGVAAAGLMEYRGPERRMAGQHFFGRSDGAFGIVANAGDSINETILAWPTFPYSFYGYYPYAEIFGYPTEPKPVIVSAIGEGEDGSLYIGHPGGPVKLGQYAPVYTVGGIYRVVDEENGFLVESKFTEGKLRLKWFARKGFMFRMESSSNLETWVEEDVLNGVDDLVEVVKEKGVGVRFYRVRIAPVLGG